MVQSDVEFVMWPRMILNPSSSSLFLLSAERRELCTTKSDSSLAFGKIGSLGPQIEVNFNVCAVHMCVCMLHVCVYLHVEVRG